MNALLLPVTAVAALGCGLMAGLFFAFSNFVMKALARLRLESGLTSMRSINVAILNPVFLALFLGTPGACLILVLGALARGRGPETAWLVGGGALYLFGAFGVTIAFNVPRNESLAHVEASQPEAARAWRDYVLGWTRWNHVRTVAALAASAALIVGLCRLSAAAG